MNYVIQEDNDNKINEVVNYNDIVDLVNNLDVSKNNYENENYDDNWFALIYQYEADYTKKELDKILIIIIFQKERRKKWNYAKK